MSYVLNYVVMAGGRAYQSTGTDHYDALMNFVDRPGHFFGRGGTYAVEDGEQITLVGPEQQPFADRMLWESMVNRLRAEAAGGGKGSQRAKQNLASWEARESEYPRPENVIKTFTLKARTVFDGEEVEA
jgi:hypothetical protein